MVSNNEFLANELKIARQRKGLSQRELGRLAGVPQGHISKIENGAVDLRVSSLVELGRVLGLELVLVPRAHLPGVRAVTRAGRSESSRPAYLLDEAGDE